MYAELKCKTNFSFLRGASNPEELIVRACEIGLTSLAINDMDGVYGIPKAYGRALELIEKGAIKSFHLITGCELTLGNSDSESDVALSSLTLLCRDKAAYSLMCRM